GRAGGVHGRGGLGEVDLVGHADDEVGLDDDLVREAAVDGGSGALGDRRDPHAVADGEGGDVRTDGADDARGLVAQDDRPVAQQGGQGAVDEAHVAVAQAGRLDVDD